MRTRFTVLIPAIALATALTACGDSGPSKSSFTTKADAACQPGNATISGAAKPTNGPQVVTAAGGAATTIDAQVGVLRAMKMPGGKDKTQIGGIISAIADVSAPATALKDAAGKNDNVAMAKAVVDLQAKADAASTQAQAYGLTQCGTGLKPAVANISDGARTILKSAYVTSSAALCRNATSKADAVAPPGTSAASIGKFFDAELAISTKLAADLRALPVPPGDEGTVNDLLGAFDNLNAKAKDITAAAKANNMKLVGALSSELDVADTALNAKFDAYGLTVCGTSGI